MSSGYWPANTEIRKFFTEETENAGGTVIDTFLEGSRLFIRSVMPGFREIAPGDNVKGGVALRANEEEIWIHPYIFRVVCENGSIQPLSIRSSRIVRRETVESLRTEQEFVPHMREAIRGCLDREALATGVEEMRETRSRGIMSALMLLQTAELIHTNLTAPYLKNIAPTLIAYAMARSERTIDTPTRHRILRRYSRDEAPTAYGLMNAVTSVARDEPDPEKKWRLEELGGLIPALPYPFEKLARDHARPPRNVEKVLQGASLQCYAIGSAAKG